MDGYIREVEVKIIVASILTTGLDTIEVSRNWKFVFIRLFQSRPLLLRHL